MALTDAAIRQAKPRNEAYKMADGGGLYLLVKSNSGKYWRLKYRILGKEKVMALGVYPEIRLVEARAKRNEARKLIAGGIDPLVEKHEQRRLATSYSSTSRRPTRSLPERHQGYALERGRVRV